MSDAPIIERNIVIDEESFALVVTTHHDGAVATTAIHRHDFQRRIGGARFVESTGGLSEVGHLSSTMTEKCMAAMIPADGQKSVIVTGSSAPLSEEKKAAILIEHVRVVKDLDPGVIVGPDMNPESVQDLAARAEGLLDHFTGLSTASHKRVSSIRRHERARLRPRQGPWRMMISTSGMDGRVRSIQR